MTHYNYLIIGGGMTADAAARGIRDIDAKGSVGLIGEEPHPPYNRPPLSKKLWQGKPLESIWRKTETLDVEMHLGRAVQTLDLPNKRVTDDQGNVYSFERLLLATGGTPRRFPFGGDDILYFRTLDDYQKLRTLSDGKQRFAVIGGGFIGSEIAAALTMNGKDVVMIFPGEGIGARMFPHDLSQFLNRYYQEKGIELLAGSLVIGLTRQGEELRLNIRDNRTGAEKWLLVDGVVAGIGIEPNIALAQRAGLPVDNGIVVDEYLRAGNPDVYAAGDVANFYNPALGRRIRVEHENNALTMGRHAGRNMAGETTPYHYLPYFYSDLFELGYEAIGLVDPQLETIPFWSTPYQKGVVYYLQDRRVRGVLLWNVWEKAGDARNLIAEPGPFKPEDLPGRL
ncbi:NAD(P)/FAD-dependent oxidoreductase [Methylobacter sp.]|uniref:NAD(P)/FAD-dependent oxidoreductase n=1 Tax=Methylobacter sp. TaxID=2051955 RepID=UPI003DA270E3